MTYDTLFSKSRMIAVGGTSRGATLALNVREAGSDKLWIVSTLRAGRWHPVTGWVSEIKAVKHFTDRATSLLHPVAKACNYENRGRHYAIMRSCVPEVGWVEWAFAEWMTTGRYKLLGRKLTHEEAVKQFRANTSPVFETLAEAPSPLCDGAVRYALGRCRVPASDTDKAIFDYGVFFITSDRWCAQTQGLSEADAVRLYNTFVGPLHSLPVPE